MEIKFNIREFAIEIILQCNENYLIMSKKLPYNVT